MKTGLFKLFVSFIKQIENLQRRAKSRSNPFFNRLGWLPFYSDVFINRCAIVVNKLNGRSPKYMNSIVITNSDRHNRQTLICPKYNKVIAGGRSFSVRTDSRTHHNVKTFKNNHEKQVLPSLDKAYYYYCYCHCRCRCRWRCRCRFLCRYFYLLKLNSSSMGLLKISFAFHWLKNVSEL